MVSAAAAAAAAAFTDLTALEQDVLAAFQTGETSSRFRSLSAMKVSFTAESYL